MRLYVRSPAVGTPLLRGRHVSHRALCALAITISAASPLRRKLWLKVEIWDRPIKICIAAERGLNIRTKPAPSSVSYPKRLTDEASMTIGLSIIQTSHVRYERLGAPSRVVFQVQSLLSRLTTIVRKLFGAHS
jgi:hypothetical protein